MNKNTVTIDASVTAFAGTLSVARASQLAAVEAWADVYEAAAFMLGQVPSRSLAKQLEASGASCNKDTAGFYADAAVWAPFMRTDGDVDSLFMRAAVAADQSATLLPHECVSYGRNRSGLTIEEVRDLMADAALEACPPDTEVWEGEEAEAAIKVLAKAIRTLRTKAKAKRTPQPPEIDDETDGDIDGDIDGETDGDIEESEESPEAKALNYATAIVGPMHAYTKALLDGSLPLTDEVETMLNAHWHELVKAARAAKAARKSA